MTIRNYTFFSPNGTEFPVSANADAKLYMMLANQDYSQFKLNHWAKPTNTGLNRLYNNTSILLGGRYFELSGEPVQLAPNSTNYIHANIDPSNTLNPVTLSVEQSINQNTVDINNGTGIIKHVIETLVTDATKVTKVTVADQTQNDIVTKSIKSSDDTGLFTINAIGAPTAKIRYMRVNGIVYVSGEGNWGNFGTANQNIVKGNLPVGFRPPYSWQGGMNPQGGQNFMSINVQTNGQLFVNSSTTGTKYGGFSISYPAGN